jgi:hypothetical protein
MIEVRLDLGAKTFACLVLENIFRSGIGMIDGLHGVNVKSIKMSTNFSPEIILREDEAMKLYKKLRTLAPRLNAGLRNQMVRQMENIKYQIKESRNERTKLQQTHP